ncbi:hypothetical protein [Nostoc sp.]|uniref:hypothetical protein n=1 Tax=Nostoc sp. TaxID=1180 RepID=UPI002FF9A96C
MPQLVPVLRSVHSRTGLVLPRGTQLQLMPITNAARSTNILGSRDTRLPMDLAPVRQYAS